MWLSSYHLATLSSPAATKVIRNKFWYPYNCLKDPPLSGFWLLLRYNLFPLSILHHIHWLCWLSNIHAYSHCQAFALAVSCVLRVLPQCVHMANDLTFLKSRNIIQAFPYNPIYNHSSYPYPSLFYFPWIFFNDTYYPLTYNFSSFTTRIWEKIILLC